MDLSNAQSLDFNRLFRGLSEIPKIKKDLAEIREILLNQSDETAEPKDELLTVDQVADFLKLSKPTIYSKVSRGELPYMKRGKRLYFSKEELTDYIKAGRVKTNSELKAEAESYLSNKKGLNNE